MVVLSVGLSFAQPVYADDEKLGKVNFETSCKPDAQKLFNQAMLYQHSFWYRASQRTFEDVAEGRSRVRHRLLGHCAQPAVESPRPPPAKNLADGAAMIAKGKSVGAKTQRERDYLDALGVMYADYEKVDHRTRIVAYAKAMEQLAQRYPDDDEAQIHYALALNTSASPADKTYASQLKGAAILEPIAKRQPQHPGVAHYLIHLYDYPAIAEKGLEAARRYAKIAPGGGPCPAHAVAYLHTRRLLGANPSHRMPRRRVSRKKTRTSTTSCTPWTTRSMPICSSGRTEGQGHHRRDERRQRFHRDFLPGPYALAVSPARYAVERGDWKAAAELAGPPQPVGSGTGDHLFCPRPRRGPLRQSRWPPRPTSPSSPSCATSCASKGRLLVRAGRHSAAGRNRLDALRRRQAATTR